LLAQNAWRCPPVLTPSGFVFGFGRRAILAVADCADVGSVGAQSDEVLADGVGPLFAEGEIVLWGAPGVGVAGNNDLSVGVITEVVCQLIQFWALFCLDREAVVRKKDSFTFEGVVIRGIRVPGAFGQRGIVDGVGTIAKGGPIAFFGVVGATGKDGYQGYKE